MKKNGIGIGHRRRLVLVSDIWPMAYGLWPMAYGIPAPLTPTSPTMIVSENNYVQMRMSKFQVPSSNNINLNRTLIAYGAGPRFSIPHTFSIQVNAGISTENDKGVVGGTGDILPW